MERGVLSQAAVVDESVTVEPVRRRNNNLRVAVGGHGGFFVKQADPLSLLSSESVAAEGEFYSGVPLARPLLEGLLPDLVFYDAPSGTVVLELLSEHQTLRQRCAAAGPLSCPTHLWRGLGRAVATIHRSSPGNASPMLSVRHALNPDAEVLADIGPAALQVLEVMQNSGIRDGLLSVADQWEPTVFTHGDLRVDNVLVSATEPEDLRVVDWEMSGRADPMWDLAACFEAAITVSHGRFSNEGLCLPVVQTTARTAWAAYYAGRGEDVARGPAELGKAAQFTGARLALTALELSTMTGRLTNAAVSLLQVADNIFADPQRAAVDLLALAV